MASENPKLALDSILASEVKSDSEFEIHNLTMARMALLELVESPFLNQGKLFSVSNMADSAFIMCADSSELKGYTSKNIDSLKEKAMEWAETVDVSVLPKIIEGTMDMFRLLYKVNPSTGSSGSSSDDSSGKVES